VKAYADDTTLQVLTLVELLRSKAVESPGRKVFTFLANGEEESATLTYGEFDRKARALGTALQRLAARGERALLLFEPGLEFIPALFGCLYGGLIAVPAYPPRLNQKASRLRSIIKDCRPTVVLTTSALMARADAWAGEAEELKAMAWIATDGVEDELADEWREPALDGGDVAFIQYTSGSTATPKGVMISHANVLHNVNHIDEVTGHTADSVSVNWLPLFHDLGLIYGVMYPLFKGMHCVHLPPAAFLQRPVRWIQAISRYKSTHNIAPDFAYDLCARKVTPEQLATLELSHWQRAASGAEPVRKATIDRFAETFAPCGFRAAVSPAYGLAEATLKVTMTGGRVSPLFLTVSANALSQNRVELMREGDAGSQTLVGCGEPSSVTRLAIVNPETLERCAPDEVGEIWVSGPSVGQGYWERFEETVRTFNAFIVEGGEGPFLRTGDLGFVRDGELFITGRLKDLIIIGGQNHYPQDIEVTAAQSHPAIRAGHCAAYAVEAGGQERLVLTAELERSQRRTPAEEIERAVRASVAEEHGLRVYELVLVKTGSIPKTSSGKLQRYACRAAYLSERAERGQ
jgi:acyl-CoA synthetase (AMP-forming)/AMP-acid ligase II